MSDKKLEEDKALPVEDSSKKDKDKPKDREVKDNALSEEDEALKEGLELAVTRLYESDAAVDLHRLALQHLVTEIRTSTSSMTSVPKPLKFLRPHYDTLKGVFEKWDSSHELKKDLADVLAVLAMTMAAGGSRECLRFKVQGNKVGISQWGHEFVRSLAGEISEEVNFRRNEDMNNPDIIMEEGILSEADLNTLVSDIVPFQMRHNAEADACDLLIEVRQLHRLVDEDDEGDEEDDDTSASMEIDTAATTSRHHKEKLTSVIDSNIFSCPTVTDFVQQVAQRCTLISFSIIAYTRRV